MDSNWQLICYHTYSGIPQIVADLSEANVFADAEGLANSDFLTDGASTGSGSVQFYRAGSRVRVPTNPYMSPLRAVRADVTFQRSHGGTSQQFTLLDSDNLKLYLRGDVPVAWFRGLGGTQVEVSPHLDQVGTQEYVAPFNRWTTLSAFHDGVSTMELYADGALIAKRNAGLQPLGAIGGPGLSIGNSFGADNLLNGSIDEVKVWRSDPLQMLGDFLNRPMDDETKECYVRFFADVRSFFERHPECTATIRTGIEGASQALMRDARQKGPETVERVEKTRELYRTLWSSGQLDSTLMVSMLSDLATWLQLAGVGLHNDSQFMRMLESSCWQTFVREVHAPTCDYQLMSLMRSLESRVPREEDWPRPLSWLLDQHLSR